jgi:O-antigen/teichoic acid export membrane protein
MGQLFSRLLQIFYVAALARYVGPEGIGKISSATALNGLTILLVAPGISTLLVRDVATDRKLTTTYLGNTLFIRSIVGVPFVILTVVIGVVSGYSLDTIYIVFVYALVYLFDALGQLFSSVFQAYETMEYEALAQVVRDLVNVSLSLICIFLRLPLLVIVVVTVIAQVCKFTLLAWITHRRLFLEQLDFKFHLFKDLLIRSLPFGALVILFSIRFQLGIFILSLFETVDAVGIYSAATTLVLMLLMLPSAFSSAVFPAYSRLYGNDRDSLPRFYQLSYKYLMLVGFPIGLVVMFFGGKIVQIIYGEGFVEANASIIILASSFFTMMGYSNGPLLNAIGKQRFFAWTQALLVLADALLCLIFIPQFGPAGAALANALSGVGGLIIHSVACHRQLGLSLPWASALKTFISTLSAGGAVLAASWLGVNWWLVLLIIAPMTYLVPILLFKLVEVDEIRFLASGVPRPT